MSLAVLLTVGALPDAVAGQSGAEEGNAPVAQVTSLECGPSTNKALKAEDLDHLCTALARLIQAQGHRISNAQDTTDGPSLAPTSRTAPADVALRLEMMSIAPQRLSGRLIWQHCDTGDTGDTGACTQGGQSPVLNTSVRDAPQLPAAAIDEFLQNLLRLAGWPGVATAQGDG